MIEKASEKINRLEAKLDKITALVRKQAADEGLWFRGTAPEAYLQQELRELHILIEGGLNNPLLKP